jgi:hypothetical protein
VTKIEPITPPSPAVTRDRGNAETSGGRCPTGSDEADWILWPRPLVQSVEDGADRAGQARFSRPIGVYLRVDRRTSRWWAIASSSRVNAPLWKNVSWTPTFRSGLVPECAADAHRSAARRSIKVLLVGEQMVTHRQIAEGLGLPSEQIPPMSGTPGMQVSNLMLRHFSITVAAGSVTLAKKQNPGVSALGKLRHRFAGDSPSAFSDGRVNRYGSQIIRWFRKLLKVEIQIHE